MATSGSGGGGDSIIKVMACVTKQPDWYARQMRSKNIRPSVRTFAKQLLSRPQKAKQFISLSIYRIRHTKARTRTRTMIRPHLSSHCAKVCVCVRVYQMTQPFGRT